MRTQEGKKKKIREKNKGKNMSWRGLRK